MTNKNIQENKKFDQLTKKLKQLARKKLVGKKLPSLEKQLQDI